MHPFALRVGVSVMGLFPTRSANFVAKKQHFAAPGFFLCLPAGLIGSRHFFQPDMELTLNPGTSAARLYGSGEPVAGAREWYMEKRTTQEVRP